MSWRLCPKCRKSRCDTVDSRWDNEGAVRRRNECRSCGYKFATVEIRIPEGGRTAHYIHPVESAVSILLTDLGNYLRAKQRAK